MSELIAITTDAQGASVVSARELHEFLEVRTRFATWVDRRIAEFGFVEGQDFTTYSQNWEKGRPEIEYALTLDMAKELSMVERNEKGKQARQWFIDKEKQLQQLQQNQNPVVVARMSGAGMFKDIRFRLERGRVWVNADDIQGAEFSSINRYGNRDNRTVDRWFLQEESKTFFRGVQAFSQVRIEETVINDSDGLWLLESVAFEYARWIKPELRSHLNSLSGQFKLTPHTPLVDRIKASQLDLLATELVGLVRQKLL